VRVQSAAATAVGWVMLLVHALRRVSSRQTRTLSDEGEGNKSGNGSEHLCQTSRRRRYVTNVGAG
jgi:hypothetical protein